MSATDDIAWRARGPLVVGYAALLILVGGLATWSVRAEIASAVVARGTVQFDVDRQVIQHREGGIVNAIHVRDGDSVLAGDVLIELDDTVLRSELAVLERQDFEIAVRMARYIAERDGLTTMPPAVNAGYETLDASWMQAQRAGQEALFKARRDSFDAELAQLREQRRQIASQIAGTTSQIEAIEAQRSLITAELSDKTVLHEKGLLPAGKLLDLRREQSRLIGEMGRLTAAVAVARSHLAGLEIGTLRRRDDRSESAIERLRDLRIAQSTLRPRALVLSERLARLDLRAPVDGVIFESRVQAARSLILPGDPLMFVVPGDQPVQIVARIDPTQVDQVFPGQEVGLRVLSSNRPQSREIPGTVLRVSADTVLDEAGGRPVFEATIRPDPTAIAAQQQMLRTGMQVEAYLRTEDRSPLSYLTQPLTSYFRRALREG